MRALATLLLAFVASRAAGQSNTTATCSLNPADAHPSAHVEGMWDGQVVSNSGGDATNLWASYKKTGVNSFMRVDFAPALTVTGVRLRSTIDGVTGNVASFSVNGVLVSYLCSSACSSFSPSVNGAHIVGSLPDPSDPGTYLSSTNIAMLSDVELRYVAGRTEVGGFNIQAIDVECAGSWERLTGTVLTDDLDSTGVATVSVALPPPCQGPSPAPLAPPISPPVLPSASASVLPPPSSAPEAQASVTVEPGGLLTVGTGGVLNVGSCIGLPC